MSTVQIVGATLRFVPGLIWAILAYGSWQYVHRRRPRNPWLRLLPVLASLVALDFMGDSLFWLVPVELHARRDGPLPVLYTVSDLLTLAALAVMRHFVWYLPDERSEPPPRSWLLATYGSAALVATLALFLDALIPLPTLEERLFAYRVIYILYVIGVLGLAARDMGQLAIRGAWRPGGPIVLRRLDVAMLVAGALALGGILVMVAIGHGRVPPLAWLTLDVVIGVAFTIPVAARILGDVVRVLLFAVVTAAAAAALYLGGHAIVDPLVGATGRRNADLAIVLVLVFALAVGQPWLRAAIDRVVFRPSRRRRAELQASLHALSPDLGVVECCQRALAELTRIMQFQGAAVMLRDGEAIAHGALPLGGLVAVWPRGAAADLLPARTVPRLEMRELPATLRDTVIEAGVLWVVPVSSPRLRWGHLLVAGGPAISSYTEEDLLATEAFADQLALLLAGAALLARAVAVERSLAHAEKLAAIGETAARIAHDIRNPVTAARSLAQQLAREPAAPFREELGVILDELERVERQVASLLRFARREDLRLAHVDLAELVRGAVASLGPRLEAASVQIGLDLESGVIARADAEKVRQAVVNLLENALDALGAMAGPRRVDVAVAAVNGCASLSVGDSGPGVPAEALPRLFEPFFSLKPQGTGLGLAIVKRTVDGHGGHVAAKLGARGGLRIDVELPLAGAPA